MPVIFGGENIDSCAFLDVTFQAKLLIDYVCGLGRRFVDKHSVSKYSFIHHIPPQVLIKQSNVPEEQNYVSYHQKYVISHNCQLAEEERPRNDLKSPEPIECEKREAFPFDRSRHLKRLHASLRKISDDDKREGHCEVYRLDVFVPASLEILLSVLIELRRPGSILSRLRNSAQAKNPSVVENSFESLESKSIRS